MAKNRIKALEEVCVFSEIIYDPIRAKSARSKGVGKLGSLRMVWE